MNQEEQNLLKELQVACLKECEDFLNGFRELLSSLKSQPRECIQGLQKVIHSMKGNLQAVAYTHFGDYVHQLESALDKIDQMIAAQAGPLSDDDGLVLEFLVSNTLDAMDSYLNELKKGMEDAASMKDKRREPLQTLALWTLTSPPSASAPPPAPVSAWDQLEPVVTEAIEKPAEKVKPTVEETENLGSGLFLLFQNGAQYFAIAIEHIVEVIKAQTLCAPPMKRKNLFGLLNLRGEVLPIVQIEKLAAEGEWSSRYVVVAQLQDRRFGFQVEAVHQVVSLDSREFQAVEKAQFCQLDGKTISVLSLNEVVAA